MFSDMLAISFQVIMNTVIFVDIWLTIKNPFFDREQRVKYYWALIFVMLAIYANPLKELLAVMNQPDDTDSEK
jgi:hypothetical protein